MANQSGTIPTLSPDDTRVEHPPYQTGIGITQWLAGGLVAFSIFMVLLAIVINLIMGSPGG